MRSVSSSSGIEDRSRAGVHCPRGPLGGVVFQQGWPTVQRDLSPALMRAQIRQAHGSDGATGRSGGGAGGLRGEALDDGSVNGIAPENDQGASTCRRSG